MPNNKCEFHTTMAGFKPKKMPDCTCISPGDFTFLENENEEATMADAYKAVSEANGWEWLKLPTTPKPGYGFAFDRDPKLSEIGQYIKTDHSGSSFAITMRNIEFIAKNGWDAYVKHRTPPPPPPTGTTLPRQEF